MKGFINIFNARHTIQYASHLFLLQTDFPQTQVSHFADVHSDSRIRLQISRVRQLFGFFQKQGSVKYLRKRKMNQPQ